MDTPILSPKSTLNSSQVAIIKIAAWGQVVGFVLNFLAIILQGSAALDYSPFFDGPVPTKENLAEFFPRISAIVYSLSLVIYIPSVACMVPLYAQLNAPISSGLMAVGASVLAVTYSSALGIMALVPYLSQELDDSVFTTLYLVALEFGNFASNYLAFTLPVLPLILARFEVGSDLTPKWVHALAITSVITSVTGVIVFISAPTSGGFLGIFSIIPLVLGLIVIPWWVLKVALPRVS